MERVERWLGRRGHVWAYRAVAALGVLSLVSALVPASRRRLAMVGELMPGFAPAVATTATVLAGAALLLVAGGLRRRKRRAWWAALALAGASVVLHLVKGLDVEEAGLSLGVLVLLLATRRQFSGAPDPRPGRLLLSHGLGAGAIVLAAGSAVVLADRDALARPAGAGAVLAHAALGLVGITGPVSYSSPATSRLVGVVLLGLGAVLAAVLLREMLRPGRADGLLSGEQEQQVRALLAEHGDVDSLGYFALRTDKSVVFSPSGKAAVSYRVVSGVALASADPLGSVEAWPGAVDAWHRRCREQAWIPAVLGASEQGATVYRRELGLDALELGDEAVVELGEFTLQGRAMRGVRQAVARMDRAGIVIQVSRVADLHAEVAALRTDVDAWRDGPVERGFSMALGRFADDRDPDAVLVLASDSGGGLLGVLSFVPWGARGLSLDVMRRSPDAENGLVETMVVALLEAAPGLAVERVSLNFAVFRSVFDRGSRIGAGPVLRMWHRILLWASRFWQIESLYRANAKYRPLWEPRFLCFAEARDLPRVAVAALLAEAFIQRPQWRLRRAARAARAA